MPEPAKPKPSEGLGGSTVWRLATLGFDLAIAVGGFTLLGWLADRYWQVFPRYTVTGAVLGLIGGMYNLIRQSLAASRDMPRTGTDDDDPPAGGSRSG